MRRPWLLGRPEQQLRAVHARLRFCSYSMQSEIAKLAHLQEVEQEIVALTAQMATYARRVAAREAALRETGRQLEENVKAIAHEVVTRRRLESDIEDLRQKAQRYRAQLEVVQSDGQMKALEHQIAFCRQEIDRLEEVEFASLVQTETLEEQQRKLHETLANLKLALANEEAEARQGMARDEKKQAELAQERSAMRADIEASLLVEYDRIASSRKTAVARVEGQRCSACQMMVRPQRWNEIRQGAAHFCESCGRFLHYDPAVDLTDAMHLPATTKKPAGLAKSPSHSHAAAAGFDHPPRED